MKKIVFLSMSILLLTSCKTAIGNLDRDDLELGDAIVVNPELVEISGLQYFDDRFYGFNDSGGEPTIYAFKEDTPQSLQSINIDNAINIDWEDIAASDSQIFIGDFGNNRGNRKDQTIYIMDRDDLNDIEIEGSLESRPIQFFYPEQKDFTDQSYNHDFDMESMVYFNNELHLFTKEWKSENTHHYTLDLVKGVQPAWLVESFDLGFLATGADLFQINKNKSRLAIVGYNRDGEVFLLLTEVGNDSYKWLDKSKSIIKLGVADDLGQVEGVAFKNKDEICISAEAINSDLGNKEQNIRCIRIK